MCSAESIINPDVAKRLLLGQIYVGPVPKECVEEAESKSPLMLFAIPVLGGKDGFAGGVVFEASTFLDYIYSYNVGNSLNGFISAEVVIDDVAKYEPKSEIYKLLHLKAQLGKNGAIPIKGIL